VCGVSKCYNNQQVRCFFSIDSMIKNKRKDSGNNTISVGKISARLDLFSQVYPYGEQSPSNSSQPLKLKNVKFYNDGNKKNHFKFIKL